MNMADKASKPVQAAAWTFEKKEVDMKQFLQKTNSWDYTPKCMHPAWTWPNKAQKPNGRGRA
jgi:hypothetical protein